MSEENVEVVRRTTEVVQTAMERYGLDADMDVEAIAGEFDAESLAAPDFELIPAREVPGVDSYRGFAGLLGFMRTWTENFDEFSNEYDQFIAAPDDRVVALAHQSATGKGSGAPVELDYGLVFELRNRRVIRIRLFLNRAEAFEAAGLSE